MLGGIGAAMTLVLAFWYARNPEGFLSEILGVNDQALQVPWAWVLALVVAAGYSLYTLWAIPLVNEYKWRLGKLKLVGVWAAVTSSTVEEIVFRQMLMDLAESWGVPALGQVLVSAVVFGAAHGVWVLLGGQLRVAVPVMTATGVLGAALAVVYLVGDRNVLPVIVAHILINLIIEPWLMLSATSRRMIEESEE
ncbi:CPBP family intramembrane glutamic endopeptidase [Nesterenkonia populi]